MRLAGSDPCLSWGERGVTLSRSTTDTGADKEVGLAEATQVPHPGDVLLTPEGSGSERLALARTAFLTEGVAVPNVVREPILASWTRSRLWDVPVDHLDVPFESDLDAETILLRAARPVLREAAEQFGDEPVSIILCDANGIVLTRDTGDTRLEQSLDLSLIHI